MAAQTNDMPKTDDGLQIHMGVNFFGHYLLTRLLMPLLKTTAANENGDEMPRWKCDPFLTMFFLT